MRKLLLFDGHSLIHRAYHAFPKTLSAAGGELTNAVYGFTRILLDTLDKLAPTHAAVAFDLPAPTFREQMFVGYKKSRVKPEDQLIAQIPRVKEVVAALNIPAFAAEGYEADDLIGTLAKQAISENSDRHKVSEVSKVSKASKVSKVPKASKVSKVPKASKVSSVSKVSKASDTLVVILTSDRDLMQLISGDQIVIKMPLRNSAKRTVLARRGQSSIDIWNQDRFIKEWGFSPQLLTDYKALAGDPSDDIPGVHGIGKVTAQKLIIKFGEINQIYQNIDLVKDIFGKNASEKLIQDQEAAQMSKKLATIDTDSPIKLDWEAMAIHEYDKSKATQLFEGLNFKSLIDKLPNDNFEQSVQDTLF